ncbi:MAG: phosphoglycolate phosphatase [Desulfurococcales archaeon]|nr:phosphoglycolate phosphatase [Desulfurococcales archaeon]
MIKLVASDIDGTLTERRGSLILALDAIKAIRMLERSGIRVSLISGNSLPITAGLARYVGASGPSIGENGCLILYNGELIHLCDRRPPLELVNEIKALGLRESWQNRFRLYDLAFLAEDRSQLDNLSGKVMKIAEKYGFRILNSGYAIHVQPPGAGKARGLLKVIELLGVEPRNVAVVGDGENDAEMFMDEFFKACPADADPVIKSISDYIADKMGGEGFYEIARYILNTLNR